MDNTSIKLVILLLASLGNFLTESIDIERRSTLNDIPANIFLSIDKFDNLEVSSDKDRKVEYCQKLNATCDDKECKKCACKDFNTFLSYEVGCVSKQNGDAVLGGKVKQVRIEWVVKKN